MNTNVIEIHSIYDQTLIQTLSIPSFQDIKSLSESLFPFDIINSQNSKEPSTKNSLISIVSTAANGVWGLRMITVESQVNVEIKFDIRSFK